MLLLLYGFSGPEKSQFSFYFQSLKNHIVPVLVLTGLMSHICGLLLHFLYVIKTLHRVLIKSHETDSVIKKQVTYRLELKMWFVFKSKFFTGISETCSAFITAWILQKMLLSYVCKETICYGWTHVVSYFVDLWLGASTDALTSCCTKNNQKTHF